MWNDNANDFSYIIIVLNSIDVDLLPLMDCTQVEIDEEDKIVESWNPCCKWEGLYSSCDVLVRVSVTIQLEWLYV